MSWCAAQAVSQAGTSQAALLSAPEVLVAHWPIVLFTPQQQAAAADLTRLVASMGGVSATRDIPTPTQQHTATEAPAARSASAFVSDHSAWLSYTADAASPEHDADPELAADMTLVGTDLLLHCVRRGACDLAQLLVSSMVQASGVSDNGVTGDKPAVWFLAAAGNPAVHGGEERTVSPLLHSAMASGRTDMLERVLR